MDVFVSQEEEDEENAVRQVEVLEEEEDETKEVAPHGDIVGLSAAKSCSVCIVVANSNLASTTTTTGNVVWVKNDGDTSRWRREAMRWRCP